MEINDTACLSILIKWTTLADEGFSADRPQYKTPRDPGVGSNPPGISPVSAENLKIEEKVSNHPLCRSHTPVMAEINDKACLSILTS